MHHSYKTLPELSNYSDNDKKIIYKKVCASGMAFFITWLSLVLIVTVVNSSNPYDIVIKDEVWRITVKTIIIGAVSYVFSIYKLNSVDRYLLQDYLKSAQQVDAPEPPAAAR